jgi:hypothetical protein
LQASCGDRTLQMITKLPVAFLFMYVNCLNGYFYHAGSKCKDSFSYHYKNIDRITNSKVCTQAQCRA